MTTVDFFLVTIPSIYNQYLKRIFHVLDLFWIRILRWLVSLIIKEKSSTNDVKLFWNHRYHRNLWIRNSCLPLFFIMTTFKIFLLTFWKLQDIIVFCGHPTVQCTPEHPAPRSTSPALPSPVSHPLVIAAPLSTAKRPTLLDLTCMRLSDAFSHAWLISLNKMILSFVYVVTNDRISFFCVCVAEQHSIVYTGHISFIHSPVDGHLGWCHLLGLVLQWRNIEVYVMFSSPFSKYAQLGDCWIIWWFYF